MTIAALFVETGGHYFGLKGVDPWDVTRDARNYSGPWPVVAHKLRDPKFYTARTKRAVNSGGAL